MQEKRELVHREGEPQLAPGTDPELVHRLLAAPAIRVVHRNRRGAVVEIQDGDARFARKHYHGHWLPPLAILRRSPALRAWQILLRGDDRGLPLPDPVCLGRSVSGSVLITRWFEGDHLHKVHARHRSRFAANRAELDRFLGAIADAVVALIRGGLETRDLAPQNLLVGEIPQGWRAVLVDLDDARLVDRVPAGRIIESLAQLGHLPPTISARERIRLFDLFIERGGSTLLEGTGITRIELRRDLAGRIANLTRRKEERLRARGATDHPFAGWGLDRDGQPKA